MTKQLNEFKAQMDASTDAVADALQALRGSGIDPKPMVVGALSAVVIEALNEYGSDAFADFLTHAANRLKLMKVAAPDGAEPLFSMFSMPGARH